MRVGLSFDEYVELKLKPAARAEGSLADRPGEVIDLAEIDQQANRWESRLPQRQQRRRSRAYYHFRQHAHGCFHFLGRLHLPVLPPHPCAGLIGAFADFQRHAQGLASQTIAHRCRQVQVFSVACV